VLRTSIERLTSPSGQLRPAVFFSHGRHGVLRCARRRAGRVFHDSVPATPTDEVGADIHGPLILELTWTIIPLLLSMVMFVWGASLFFQMSKPP